MKDLVENVYTPSDIAFKQTVMDEDGKPLKWNAGDRSYSAKGMLKTRGLEGDLSNDTYKEILEANGWEMVEKPRFALWRRLQDRKWAVYEDGELIDTVIAKTKDEAMTAASKKKYGKTKKFTDQKGRERFIWELNKCDMSAEEVK